MTGSELEETRDEITGASAARQKPSEAPNISVEMEDGVARVHIGETSSEANVEALMKALGTEDTKILDGFLSQIGNAVSMQCVNEQQMQFAIAFVKSVEPENEMEMLLATQMAAAHICSMEASRLYMNGSTLPGRDSAERAANKFMRTFAAQIDALKRFRHGGQQKVTVEHVTVNEGGQAIVGPVKHGGRG